MSKRPLQAGGKKTSPKSEAKRGSQATPVPEALEILEAIRSGSVDAFVVEPEGNPAIHTLYPVQNSDADQVLNAIQAGEVDAFVVGTREGERILTLHGADASYMVLLDQIKEGSITLNCEGKIIFAGDRISNMLQIDASEMLGRSFGQYVLSEQRDSFERFLSEACKSDASGAFDLTRGSAAMSFPVMLKGRGFDLTPTERAAGLIVSDVTDELLLEKLRQSEERYRYAAKASQELIFEYTVATDEMRLSPAVKELFGYDVEVVTRGWWIERVHPDDRMEVENAGRAFMTGSQDRHDRSYYFQRANGSYAYINNRGFAVRDGDGLAVKVYGAAIDLTELHEQELALRNAREILELALEAADVGIWKIDLRTRTSYRDARLNRMLGVSGEPGQFPMQDFMRRIHPEDRERVKGEFNAAAQAGTKYDTEFRIVTPEGRIRWVREFGHALSGEDGPQPEITGATVDIISFKETEIGLRNLNLRLEERVADATKSLRRRSSQLRQLAHEQTRMLHRDRKRIAERLHNDLQQILVSAMMQLDSRVASGPRAGEAIKSAHGLLRQALDSSRLLTSELYPSILHHGTFNESMQWLAGEFLKKYNLEIHLDVPQLGSEPSEEVKYALFEAARELLFNVVKHSQGQEAWLAVRSGAESLALQIFDRGAGSDAHVEEAKAPHEKGGHFGLLSVRENIENYGGTFEVTTSPGEGFRIDIVMPLAFAGEQTPVPRSAADIIPALAVQVLIVEDHQLVLEGFVRILKQEPWITIVGEASSGIECLEKARRLNPDLVLMDINLPEMNGIQATRALKEQMPHIQIIALSVNQDEATMQAMREAGAVAYVPKGSTPEELLGTIRNVMQAAMQ